jgi:hypothetical protein
MNKLVVLWQARESPLVIPDTTDACLRSFAKQARQINVPGHQCFDLGLGFRLLHVIVKSAWVGSNFANGLWSQLRSLE